MSHDDCPDTPPSHPDIDIIESRRPFARHLSVDVVRFRHRLFDGGWSGERLFDVVRRGGAVAVILYDPACDSVVLVEQFRLAPLYSGRSPWQIEAVAGLVDHDGESPEAVARRETREEANLELIGDLLPIQVILPAAGSYDEVVWLFCGRIDSGAAGGVHGVAAEQEDIRVVVKTMTEIEAMLDRGQIESAHTLVMLYWLLRHREGLQQSWSIEPPA
jgi:ADP-ribose pyrophosphatase